MRNVVLPLALLCSVFADGSAHAQCAATDKIYIDPRLVPKQRHYTLQQFQAIMNAPHISPEMKAQVWRDVQQRGQPIVVPYGTGNVLVHPDNPCIQQYIP
jgi:hypothetical protein